MENAQRQFLTPPKLKIPVSFMFSTPLPVMTLHTRDFLIRKWRMRVVFRLRGVSWVDKEIKVERYSTIGGRAIRRVNSS